jgi:DNA-directed RNA polymerase subunit RPC12/RpoP
VQVRRRRSRSSTSAPTISSDTLTLIGAFIVSGGALLVVLSMLWVVVKIIALRTRASNVIRCSYCRSADVHWSRSRGIDSFYKLFGVLVYRCRRCHRRFHGCLPTVPDQAAS